MRGAPQPGGCQRDAAGIIPAYAGSTAADYTVAQAIEDHPRVCGEHAMGYNYLQVSMGSSPRMRGALGIKT